jgi:molybdenum cofactor cytidylyltransferase
MHPSTTESSPPKIAGLLLAAGGSSRLGRPKQLVEFEGKTLIRRAAEALIEAGCSPVYVVLGAEIEGSRQDLEGLKVAIVINESWASGMGSSIAVGVKSLMESETPAEAVLISLCDQPLVTADKLRGFLDTFRKTRADVVSAGYNDVAGVPALFSSRSFPDLAALEGEKGAREIIRNSPDAITIPLPEAAIDVDCDKDLEGFINR